MGVALAFVARHWRWVVFAAVAGALVWARVDADARRHERDQARAALALEKAAHQRTVDIYRGAAALAAQRDAENLARVAGEQQAITERITDAFQHRLDDSSAAYERLRAQADAYSRGAASEDVSAAREAACRAYANTACDALPGLLKAAQDNTDQLVALIAWAKAQGEVDVVGEN